MNVRFPSGDSKKIAVCVILKRIGDDHCARNTACKEFKTKG